MFSEIGKIKVYEAGVAMGLYVVAYFWLQKKITHRMGMNPHLPGFAL